MIQQILNPSMIYSKCELHNQIQPSQLSPTTSMIIIKTIPLYNITPYAQPTSVNIKQLRAVIGNRKVYSISSICLQPFIFKAVFENVMQCNM